VGPRAGMDTMLKRKKSLPCWESNTDCPACSCHCTDWAIL